MPVNASFSRPRGGADTADSAVSHCELRLTFPATNHAVRQALRSVLGGLTGLDLDASEMQALESAMAEILNNVVEHAHCERCNGLVEIRLTADPAMLSCSILDDGAAMPDNILPPGLDDWDVGSLATLPEGGFGWFLIRQQVEDLDYARDGGVNRVSFRLPLGVES